MNRQEFLFLDFDLDASPLLRSQNPLWESGMELVRLDARRLAGIIGPVKLKRTGGGVHLMSCLPLPAEKLHALMASSLADRGHVAWSTWHGESGLRVTRKSYGSHMTGEEPYLMELIT